MTDGSAQMTSGIDRLTDALRRYRLLLAACVIAGLAAALALSSASDPEYRATAQVLLNQDGSGAILPGSDQESGAAQRSASTAVTLAGSGAFYDAVARRYANVGDQEDAPDLPGDFTVEEEPGTSLLTVTATGGSAAEAERIANTAAGEFPAFRAETLSRPLRETERSLRAQLAQSPDDAQIKDSLSRVRVLERLAPRNASVVDAAQNADKIRPVPARDAVIGLVGGLIAGLLLMSLREGLSTRVRDEDVVERALGARIVARIGRREISGDAPIVGVERLVVLLAERRREAHHTVVGVIGGTGAATGRIAQEIRGSLTRRGAHVTQLVAEGAHVDGVLSLPGGHGGDGVTVDEEPLWTVVDGPGDVQSPLALELVRAADVVVLVVGANVTRRELAALAHEVDGWPRRPFVSVLTLG